VVISLVITDDNYSTNKAHLLNFRSLLLCLLPVSKFVNSCINIRVTPKRSKYSWFSSNLGSILSISSKYRKIVLYPELYQEILRFWINVGFCFKYSQSTPNFMEITNFGLNNLTSAQWLRRFHELPVYFRKICMKLASELCSTYSSKDWVLRFSKQKSTLQVLWVSQDQSFKYWVLRRVK
jgi:hypothetical protein